MVFKVIRCALAAVLCASLHLPAQADSIVGGGTGAPGFSAAGILGRGRVDSDVSARPAPAPGQFLAASIPAPSGRARGRSDSDVDVGIHKPGQWGNKPATPPVGSDTLPLPGSRHAPEPASLALLSIGAFGLAAGRLRQRKTRSETTS
jgi:hypothetical protein